MYTNGFSQVITPITAQKSECCSERSWWPLPFPSALSLSIVVPPLYLTRITQDVLVGTYIFKETGPLPSQLKLYFSFLPSLSVLCKTLRSKVLCDWCWRLGNYTCVSECPGSWEAAEVGPPPVCSLSLRQGSLHGPLSHCLALTRGGTERSGVLHVGEMEDYAMRINPSQVNSWLLRYGVGLFALVSGRVLNTGRDSKTITYSVS